MQKFVYQQFLKFSLVGGINTLIDFGIYTGLTRVFYFWHSHFLWANILAYCLATVNSFVLNKFWTFNNKDPQYLRQYGKLFLTSLGALVINELILYFFVQLGMQDLLAKIMGTLICLLWNFMLNKFWTFKVAKNVL